MEIILICTCGKILESTLYLAGQDIRIIVNLCPTCLQDTHDEGVKDGIEKGKDGP